jgi:hypothetical protein
MKILETGVDSTHTHGKKNIPYAGVGGGGGPGSKYQQYAYAQKTISSSQ